jgi:hypothetical protein
LKPRSLEILDGLRLERHLVDRANQAAGPTL